MFIDKKKVTHLQKNVRTIVHNENERANTMQIANPTEGNESDRDNVMYEHLPEIFATNIEELRGS